MPRLLSLTVTLAPSRHQERSWKDQMPLLIGSAAISRRHGKVLRVFALRGTCWAYLILSRSVSVDLDLDPQSGRVTGTYTGSRVGKAQLTGKQRGADLDLTIQWPKPLYGDTTAHLRVASVDAERFRIVVIDHIGVNGPVRATTNLTLLRR
jgi:hypothetical protein